MPHIFFHLIESLKRYLEKGALKSQQQQLSLVTDLAKISLRDQKNVSNLNNVGASNDLSETRSLLF